MLSPGRRTALAAASPRSGHPELRPQAAPSQPEDPARSISTSKEPGARPAAPPPPHAATSRAAGPGMAVGPSSCSRMAPGRSEATPGRASLLPEPWAAEHRRVSESLSELPWLPRPCPLPPAPSTVKPLRSPFTPETLTPCPPSRVSSLCGSSCQSPCFWSPHTPRRSRRLLVQVLRRPLNRESLAVRVPHPQLLRHRHCPSSWLRPTGRDRTWNAVSAPPRPLPPQCFRLAPSTGTVLPLPTPGSSQAPPTQTRCGTSDLAIMPPDPPMLGRKLHRK